MSVDSKLFVMCQKESVIEIGRKVSIALSEYSRAKVNDFWRSHTDAVNLANFMWSDKYKGDSVRFTNGCKVDTYDFSVINFNFGSGEDNRRCLSMFPTCQDDYEEVKAGYKVIFSIGHWGNAYEIMKVVADVAKEFGEVYFDFNDCDDLDFFEINYNK